MSYVLRMIFVTSVHCVERGGDEFLISVQKRTSSSSHFRRCPLSGATVHLASVELARKFTVFFDRLLVDDILNERPSLHGHWSWNLRFPGSRSVLSSTSRAVYLVWLPSSVAGLCVGEESAFPLDSRFSFSEEDTFAFSVDIGITNSKSWH